MLYFVNFKYIYKCILYLEKEMATHSSFLAWRSLWTEKPDGLLFVGSHRVGHDWSNFACMHALGKEMATHSSIPSWRIPGTEEPGGLPSMGSQRVGHDWSDLAAAAAAVFTRYVFIDNFSFWNNLRWKKFQKWRVPIYLLFFFNLN